MVFSQNCGQPIEDFLDSVYNYLQFDIYYNYVCVLDWKRTQCTRILKVLLN